MKYLYVLLSVFFPLTNIFSQEIVVEKVSKNPVCVGDTVWVSYSSTLILNGDAFFAAQISDATGSFSTFTNTGHNTSRIDSIPIVIKSASDHYKVRIIATDPYTISSNTSTDIRVLNYPSPYPYPHVRKTQYFGYNAFIGDSIKFTDVSTEDSNATYLWTFDQNTNINWTTTPAPIVTYDSVGIKTGSLSVSNSAGCETSKSFKLRILSCEPQIPDTAHIVTGTEIGVYPCVWVKAGGNYTANNNYPQYQTVVFVEPGGSLRAANHTEGIYYLRTGASIIINTEHSLAILKNGNSITWIRQDYDVDTLYCDNLQFDYSQILAKEVKQSENKLHIFNSVNTLRVNCDGELITSYIVDQLGKTMISKIDRDMISFDLSSFTNGIYFAVIACGDHHEVRKIAVAH